MKRSMTMYPSAVLLLTSVCYGGSVWFFTLSELRQHDTQCSYTAQHIEGMHELQSKRME